MALRSYGMYLAYIVQACVGANVVAAMFMGVSGVLVGEILFLLGLVPYLFSWKTKIVFPWYVYFLTSLAILIHDSGYIRERYLIFPHWDILAHTVSGAIVALYGFLLILFLDRIGKYNLDPPFIALFTVFFGMAGEYFWEVWEFFMDTFLGGSLAGLMQMNNTDTMTDMIFVLLSSVIVGVWCWRYLKRSGKEMFVNRMVKDSPYFIW